MPEIAPGPCKHNNAANSLFALVERAQTQVNVDTRTRKRRPVDVSYRVAAS